MFFFAAIPALLFLSALGLVIYGALLGDRKLTSRYMALIQSEVDNGLREVESDLHHNSLSVSGPRVLVPLRRILQFEAPPVSVVYLVGMTLVQQERSSMAAQLLRRIAPARGGGFPAAHKFLADYNVANWKDTDAQAQLMLADLETAEQGGVELSIGQLRDYAALLVRFNRRQAAADMLRQHADVHPDLNVQIVQLEKHTREQGDDAKQDPGSALAMGLADFERKRAAGTATIQDVMRAVQLEMFDNQIDRALGLANYGFSIDPDFPDFRRQFSNVLLAKHQWLSERHSAELAEAEKQGTKPPTFDMRNLSLACKIDSANPLVSEELAKAMASGHKLTPAMTQALELSLSSGTATGNTHTMQAKRKLAENDSQNVLQELRLAMNKLPDSPMAMNNLAYAILSFEPENLTEAKELIERALNSPDVSFAGRASMLDTKAEICLFEGDELKAIELFEEAIELDGSKLDTRQKLAEAYQRVGMSELAKVQLERVAELSSQ